MKGLSLAEVVFSGALALLLCLTLLSAFPTSLWAVTQGENRIQADQLAQSLLDATQARPFASLDYSTQDWPPLQRGAVLFAPTVEVFPIPEVDAALLKGLRVTVHWDERGRRRHVVHELWVSGLPRS